MFAEDVGLLPDNLFSKMLEISRRDAAGFADNARTLFGAMARPGGKVGFTSIDWFNGGLFEDDQALLLKTDDIEAHSAQNYAMGARRWALIHQDAPFTLNSTALVSGRHVKGEYL